MSSAQFRTIDEAQAAQAAASAAGDNVAFLAAFKAELRLASEENAKAAAAAARGAAPNRTTSARGNAIVLPSDRAIAIEVLRAGGLSREQALERLALDTDTLAQVAEQIETRKAALVAEQNAAEDSSWLASPDGRRHVALQAKQRKEQRDELAAAARIALEEEGHSVESLAHLSTKEILEISGIDPSKETLERERAATPEAQLEQHQRNNEKNLAARYHELSPTQREVEREIVGEEAYLRVEAAKAREVETMTGGAV